jgi:hypothetical protein
VTVPIPIPLPPWAKFVLRYGPAAGGFLWALVDYLRQEDAAEALEWRRLMVRYADGDSAEARDDMFITFDLVNVTNGNIDTTWSTTDYTNAEALFDTFFTNMKPNYGASMTVDQYRWYRRMFNPYSNTTKAFADSGPPVRLTSKTITGTAGSFFHQMACAVTEKTPWPKHWGRFYLPAIAATSSTGGRWANATVDTVAGHVNTLYQGLAAAELFPVVPVTQVDKDPLRALIGVEKIQIDNVPDVVRRRRPASVTYRKTLP